MAKKERLPESNRIRHKRLEVESELQKKNAFQNPIAFDTNILIFQRNGKKERVPESNRIRHKRFDISTEWQKKNAFQNPFAFDKNILIFQRN